MSSKVEKGKKEEKEFKGIIPEKVNFTENDLIALNSVIGNEIAFPILLENITNRIATEERKEKEEEERKERLKKEKERKEKEYITNFIKTSSTYSGSEKEKIVEVLDFLADRRKTVPEKYYTKSGNENSWPFKYSINVIRLISRLSNEEIAIIFKVFGKEITISDKT